MRRLVGLAGTAARLALGLFVTWQLLFLLSANALELAGEARAGRAGRLARTWAQWTGQHQSWQLFAPDVTEVAGFPAVELRWGPGRALVLRSENEPPDRHAFFRAGRFRLRRFESTLDVPLPPGDAPGPRDPDWRRAVARRVEDDPAPVRAYLRWRTDRFLREHPDEPEPSEAVLRVRLFRVPPPPGPDPWDWEELGEHPVARLVLRGPRRGALDAYDPARGTFGPAGEP